MRPTASYRLHAVLFALRLFHGRCNAPAGTRRNAAAVPASGREDHLASSQRRKARRVVDANRRHTGADIRSNVRVCSRQTGECFRLLCRTLGNHLLSRWSFANALCGNLRRSRGDFAVCADVRLRGANSLGVATRTGTSNSVASAIGQYRGLMAGASVHRRDRPASQRDRQHHAAAAKTRARRRLRLCDHLAPRKEMSRNDTGRQSTDFSRALWQNRER